MYTGTPLNNYNDLGCLKTVIGTDIVPKLCFKTRMDKYKFLGNNYIDTGTDLLDIRII